MVSYYYAMCKNSTPIRLEAESLEDAEEKFKKWEPIGPVKKEED